MRPFGRSASVFRRILLKNHVFCKNIFSFWGMTWNHPEWHLVKYWRVSVRSGPHFGAGPSKITLLRDFGEAVQAVCRRFWDAIFQEKSWFLQILFCVLGGLPGITRSGIWWNTGAFRCDFGAFWAAFRCGSFVICVMVGCRGGCSGGLPAVLGVDF